MLQFFIKPVGIVTAISLVLIIAGCQHKKLIKPEEAPVKKEPENVQFITSDINLFWEMYDAEFPLYTAEEIAQQYFKAGTGILTKFYEKKIHTSRLLATLLNSWQHRQYFEDIRQNSLRIDDQKDEVIKALKKFQKLYPKAVFTDIVFVIGDLSTGGVVLPNGQIVIAAEMFAKAEDTETEYFDSWTQAVLYQPNYLPVIILHELVHVQQRRYALKKDLPVGGRTLLDRALLEGSADFITELVLDDFLTKDLLAYGNANEQKLWQQFKQQMNQQSYSQWLYNGRSASEHPADIGYYIGYKITQQYYKQAADKGKAIKEIIQMSSGKAFLEASGYAKTVE